MILGDTFVSTFVEFSNTIIKSKNIPSDIDFNLVGSLSNEAKEIFLKARPETIAQAASLPGITPAAVGAMVVYLRSKAA